MIDIKRYIDFMEKNVIEVTEEVNKQFLIRLWFSIVPATPVVSGLAMYSWRMVPTSRSSYKPKMPKGAIPYNRIFPEPEPPNLNRYTRNWRTFVLFNNQDYISKLNDEDDTKYYYHFIDNGLAKAIKRTDINTRLNA